MATKAQLEAELAVLKAELATRDAAVAAAQDAAEAAAIEGATESPDHDTLEAEIGEVLAGLETMPYKHTILFALGVFSLGFMLGRGR